MPAADWMDAAFALAVEQTPPGNRAKAIAALTEVLREPPWPDRERWGSKPDSTAMAPPRATMNPPKPAEPREDGPAA